MRSLRYLFPAAALTFLVSSCGNNKDVPPLLGASTPNNDGAESLFQEAKSAESAGKRSKAIKLYDKLADDMPIAARAPEARFRQAELLQQEGEIRQSFDAYQEFLSRYNSSGLYDRALASQASMAQSAAEGQVKTSFLGLKSKLSDDKVVEMLGKVRDNAPRSATASKAQFTIGEVWESQRNTTGATKAIAAYKQLAMDYGDSKEAPEGQFRIGKILLEEARRGNQDQANLDRAREALQDYLRQYPGHSRNGEARQLMSNIGGQDIQRSFDIAKFYEQKGDTGSARFYYEEVIRKAKSGSLHDQAKARLAALGGGH